MSTANDIALVRLEKPAFTAAEIATGVHVLPICLPWGNLPNGYTAKYPSGCQKQCDVIENCLFDYF